MSKVSPIKSGPRVNEGVAVETWDAGGVAGAFGGRPSSPGLKGKSVNKISSWRSCLLV